MCQPLPDLRSCISLVRRGDIIARGWPSEDDVDLLLDRTFGSGRRVPRGSAIGERELVADIPTQVSAPDDVFNLYCRSRHSSVSYRAIWAGPPSGPRQASDGLGGLVLSGNWRCRTIGYRSWDQIEPDRKSDFATELAPESGRLRKLPRLTVVAVPFQAGPPSSGLLATSFAGVPSGEPVGELPNA
ncbi:hypothetical protein B296_00049596 [Ensete ventricosum]|uniref:Uncharacterized protein n=1 Tax=Ensete ventricosum TaxID=4639 RepID=A0A426WWL5_ENSVE|nr:hypothetical protein B296_00049596 [Ensete ventricosum]